MKLVFSSKIPICYTTSFFLMHPLAAQKDRQRENLLFTKLLQEQILLDWAPYPLNSRAITIAPKAIIMQGTKKIARH